MTGKRKGGAGFVFWKDDFLGSPLVQTMTAAEVGAYVLLILAAQDGGIPNDDVLLSRLTRTGPRWRAMKARLLSRFVIGSDGLLYHPRVEADRAESAEYRATKSASGREGNRRRWGGAKNSVVTDSNTTSSSGGKPSATPTPLQVVEKKRNGDRICDQSAIANASPPSPSPSLAFRHEFTPPVGSLANGSLPNRISVEPEHEETIASDPRPTRGKRWSQWDQTTNRLREEFERQKNGGGK